MESLLSPSLHPKLFGATGVVLTCLLSCDSLMVDVDSSVVFVMLSLKSLNDTLLILITLAKDWTDMNVPNSTLEAMNSKLRLNSVETLSSTVDVHTSSLPLN